MRDNDACPPIVVKCDLFCLVDEFGCGEGVRLIGGVGEAGPCPHFMIVTHGHEEADGADGAEYCARGHESSVPNSTQASG